MTFKKRTALTAAILLALPSPAFAYLDPGTGSMIIQSIIAIVAVGAAAISGYWYKVKTFFSRDNKDESTQSSDSENNN